jgi:hypothetical protein
MKHKAILDNRVQTNQEMQDGSPGTVEEIVFALRTTRRSGISICCPISYGSNVC